MTKAIAFAALLLTACATDGEISRGPELDHGSDLAVEDAARVTGVVRGATAGRVVLGNDTWLASQEIADGGFAFDNVPDGTYFVKLEVAGLASETQTVTVEGGAASVILTATTLATGTFTYNWSSDASRGGHEQGSLVGSARNILRDAYNIELSDEDQVWSDEHASRLLQTMRSVPQTNSAAYAPTDVAPTTWVLASDGGYSHDSGIVHMPARAFGSESASRFFARELHGLIVDYVTDGGANRLAVDKILNDRYGIRAFLFQNTESVDLISMMEDMPAGLRSLSALRTIIKRPDGAPVRATVSLGYLEVAEAAFTVDHADTVKNMVREKARFIVTPALQAAWGTGDVADAIATFITAPSSMSEQALAMMNGLKLEAARPIASVSIEAQQRTVSIELGMNAGEGASSAALYLFNDLGQYRFVSLNPTSASGAKVRGMVTLPVGGTWRPDVIVLRDRAGDASIRDMSEVGWRLVVE